MKGWLDLSMAIGLGLELPKCAGGGVGVDEHKPCDGSVAPKLLDVEAGSVETPEVRSAGLCKCWWGCTIPGVAGT